MFEIAILPTALRVLAGHWPDVSLTSAADDGFAMQGMTHIDLGMPAGNRVFSSSQLIVPIAPAV